MIESIKCHHNDFANYIENNLYEYDSSVTVARFSLRYCNFSYIPKRLIRHTLFYDLVHYNYPILVDYYIKGKRDKLEKFVIKKNLVFNSISEHSIFMKFQKEFLIIVC